MVVSPKRVVSVHERDVTFDKYHDATEDAVRKELQIIFLISAELTKF